MAEYQKSIDGKWAKGSELTNGTRAKILDEVTKRESQYTDEKTGAKKTQDVAKVRFEGKDEPLNVSFNRATIYGLIDAFGTNSNDWIGRTLKVHTEKTTVAGKRVTVLYLLADGFEVGEDANGYVVVSKIGNKKDGGEQHSEAIDDAFNSVTTEDTPF